MGLGAIADKGAAALMGRIAPIATTAAEGAGDAAARMAGDVGTFASTSAGDIIKSLQAQVSDLTNKLADATTANATLQGQVNDLTGRLSNETAQAAADMSSLDQANANIIALNNRVGPAEQKVSAGTQEVSSMTNDFNQGTNALAAYQNDANGWMAEANQLLNNVRAHIQNLGTIFGV